jgi:transcriptional regulator with XRE-family HTH domain
MAATPLRHARIDADLTLFELAHRAGISMGRLSMIERALIAPRTDEMTRLAVALGVSEAACFPESRESAVA